MKKTTNIRYLTQLSVLVAIELILTYTPLGYFKMPGLEITFLAIPVVIGAILLGPAAGAVLGGVFGLTSFGTCFGSSSFGVALMAVNPIFTFITCVPTRILMGWLTGLLFKALAAKAQGGKPSAIAFGVTSLVGPLLNTVLFTGTMTLFFYQTEFIQGFVSAMGAANPFTFMVLFVGINGLIEAVACFLVSGALSGALWNTVRSK